MYLCPSCGAKNTIVNQCGCDPNNMPTKVEDRPTVQEMATTAYDIQDASNFTGVLITLKKTTDNLRVIYSHKGNDFIAQHPIIRALLSKLNQLAKLNNETEQTAIAWCQSVKVGVQKPEDVILR